MEEYIGSFDEKNLDRNLYLIYELLAQNECAGKQ